MNRLSLIIDCINSDSVNRLSLIIDYMYLCLVNRLSLVIDCVVAFPDNRLYLTIDYVKKKVESCNCYLQNAVSYFIVYQTFAMYHIFDMSYHVVLRT